MSSRSFSNILASFQGGIDIKPGRTYKKELTRDEVLKAFGEVPEHTIRYGFVISVRYLDDNKYIVTVKRGK